MSNNEGKILNSGFNELYSEIFCNLFSTNNGFRTCKNCNYGDQTIWQVNTQEDEQNCLNNCNNDVRCTSYSFDTSKKDQNCTKYISFPTQINRNIENINSGYSLNKFGFDYNNLSQEQKNNIQNKCANQYLNNYFTPNYHDIDLSSCINIQNIPTSNTEENLKWWNILYNNASSNNTLFNNATSNNVSSNNASSNNASYNTNNTQFTMNPECVFNIYQQNNIPININNTPLYNNNINYTKSKSDPIIDIQEKLYNTYTNKSLENININNSLKPTDSTYTEYNNVVNENKINLLNNFIEYTKPKNTEFSNILEHFEINENIENKKKYFFIMFILFLILIFYVFIKK